MHHICNIQLRFPPKDELQSSLENYTALFHPLLREKKVTDIFANALADRTRSPHGLQMNIHLLLTAYDNEIPSEDHRHIFKLFSKVLTDIAIEYSKRS